MKKSALLLLLPLFVSACEYDSLPEIPKPLHYHTNPPQEPEKPAPEAGGTIPIVFSGSFGDAVSTRASISGSTVSWSADDRIMVLWDGGFNYANASAEGATAQFSTEVNEAPRYWAVYPSTLEAELTSDALSLTVPADQYGDFSKSNFAVASTAAGNTALSFRNLCALGSFTLGRSDIASVVFRGLGKETLAGKVTLNMDGEGIPVVAAIASPADSIKVINSGGGALPAGNYYFAALPGALDSGVSFTLTTVTGGTILGRAIAAKEKLNRSEIRTFGTLDADGAATSLTLRFDFGPEAGTKALKDPESKWPDTSGDEKQAAGVNYPYSLDGATYNFFVKDLAGEGKCSWRTNNSNGYADCIGIQTATIYLGLPALDGYKLTSVVVGQCRRGSGDNSPEKITTVGITSCIPEGAEKTYVAGGELQSWPGWAGSKDKKVVNHSFTLSGTEPGTVYYLNSNTQAIGLYFSRLILTYEK